MKTESTRVTSFDVAEKAGVSQATVSRALAGSTIISEATREKVLRAARELNYHVDERAASLRQGRTRSLAVVLIARLDGAIDAVNPVAHAVLAGVLRSAGKRNLQALVSYQASETEFAGDLPDRGLADGMIVIGTTANAAAWDYFRALDDGARKVAYWGGASDDLAFVRPDNHGGARQLTEYLLGKGYRKPVFIGASDRYQQQFRERLEGFNAAMHAAGLTAQTIDTPDDLLREEQGRRAVDLLLDDGIDCDSIFAACDASALGAIEQLRRRGVRCPEHIGVVGFDGIAAGSHSFPTLTTVRADFDAAGEALVEMALADSPMSRRVPVSLVERESALGPKV